MPRIYKRQVGLRRVNSRPAGDLEPGREIALWLDQILLHEATGPDLAFRMRQLPLRRRAQARGT